MTTMLVLPVQVESSKLLQTNVVIAVILGNFRMPLIFVLVSVNSQLITFNHIDCDNACDGCIGVGNKKCTNCGLIGATAYKEVIDTDLSAKWCELTAPDGYF